MAEHDHSVLESDIEASYRTRFLIGLNGCGENFIRRKC